MEDSDHVHPEFPGTMLGIQLFLRVELEPVGLLSLVSVAAGNGHFGNSIAVGRLLPEQDPAALLRVRTLQVSHQSGPRLGFDANHMPSPSVQKCSDRYLAAPSQNTVTIVPDRPSRASRAAILVAARTFAPEEIPTSIPCSRPRRRVIV